jgi:hypothetical protein
MLVKIGDCNHIVRVHFMKLEKLASRRRLRAARVATAVDAR